MQHTDETNRLEAKSASQGLGKSFIETVCAFSNEPDLGGGYILLGVSENEESAEPRYIVTGVSNPDDLQRQISSQCAELLSISIRPNIQVASYFGKVVIIVGIEEAHALDKPVNIKSLGFEKGAFRRIGSTNVCCNREDLRYLIHKQYGIPFEQMHREGNSFADFDPRAIEFYRERRAFVKPDASELKYNDYDLMCSLKAITTIRGATLPTVAGLLMFGKKTTLRREFPLVRLIDFMILQTNDLSDGHTPVEGNEGFVLAVPKMIDSIMSHIPVTYSLKSDNITRQDNPLIPRKVIREALVNAIMHRDFQVGSTTKILKYPNRIEFSNPGHSLVNPDVLGNGDSKNRNDIIATIFRDLDFAESKGSGIKNMREEMRKANLSIPLIESSTYSGFFKLTLLSHHLFTQDDIDWLAKFKYCNLSDKEALGLIVTREKGEITNAHYRTINGVETLPASADLRRLRNLGLLEQKGKGNITCYVPTKYLLNGEKEQKKSTTLFDTNPTEGSGETSTIIPTELSTLIEKIGKKTSASEIKQIIIALCKIKPFKRDELANLLRRNPKHMSVTYLTPLINEGHLKLLFPDNPKHKKQAYVIKDNQKN